MRFLRAVSASILSARFSLSAVSSSMELEAVFTSTPSFRRRSMTSWLESPRSRASWKTLTFPIRLPSLSALGTVSDGRRRGLQGLTLRDRSQVGLGRRGLCLGQPPGLLLRLLRGQPLGLLPLRLQAQLLL